MTTQPTEREPKVRANFMIAPDQLERLRLDAAIEDRSLSAHLNRVLRLYHEGVDADEIPDEYR